MYYVNPDYIAQVFLESQPRPVRNKRRTSTVTSTPSTSQHSRLWDLVRFHHAPR